MPTSKKIFSVENLAEKLKAAKGLVLADYSGLNVAQINELRREIKKTGGEFEVVKNTLFEMAAKKSSLTSQPELAGPTAALWVYEQDPAPLKVLDRFIEKNELPKIKLGFWNGEAISAEKVKELAKLPGLEELRAKLVGTLASPISSLNRALGWNLRKLILIFRDLSTRQKATNN